MESSKQKVCLPKPDIMYEYEAFQDSEISFLVPLLVSHSIEHHSFSWCSEPLPVGNSSCSKGGGAVLLSFIGGLSKGAATLVRTGDSGLRGERQAEAVGVVEFWFEAG